MTDIVKRLRKIAEQYKCPWGDPGSNPDYFSKEDYKSVLEAADEIERLQKQLVSDINAETEIDRLETEIERLQAVSLDEWIDQVAIELKKLGCNCTRAYAAGWNNGTRTPAEAAEQMARYELPGICWRET